MSSHATHQLTHGHPEGSSQILEHLQAGFFLPVLQPRNVIPSDPTLGGQVVLTPAPAFTKPAELFPEACGDSPIWHPLSTGSRQPSVCGLSTTKRRTDDEGNLIVEIVLTGGILSSAFPITCRLTIFQGPNRIPTSEKRANAMRTSTLNCSHGRYCGMESPTHEMVLENYRDPRARCRGSEYRRYTRRRRRNVGALSKCWRSRLAALPAALSELNETFQGLPALAVGGKAL